MEKETERLFNETSIENFPSTEKDMTSGCMKLKVAKQVPPKEGLTEAQCKQTVKIQRQREFQKY
jgi:hypothetical protein